MTRPAEFITIELDEEDGIWAPVSAEQFFGRDNGWTPEKIRAWFDESGPPRRKLFSLGHSLSDISTALRGGAMRYQLRGDLLFPLWAVIGVMDEDALSARELPKGCSVDRDERAFYLRWGCADALALDEPLGIARCSDSSDGLHWYVDGDNRYKREPERFIPASEGADGHP